MDRIVAYCGLVCINCPILLATDKCNEEKTLVAGLVKNQYYKEYTANDISCDGCLTDGPQMSAPMPNKKVREAKER